LVVNEAEALRWCCGLVVKKNEESSTEISTERENATYGVLTTGTKVYKYEI
jgi:hypothetical protein